MSFCEKNNIKGENMNDNLSALYTDRLPGSSGQAAAEGLSAPPGSHDGITRKLSEKRKTPAEPRRAVTPLIRQHESLEGVLIM